MSVNSDRYGRAVDMFAGMVDRADPSAWDRPSPCEGWTARHVVGHVVAVQHAIVATIDGEPAPMNPMKDPDRHAGDDPAAAWATAAGQIRARLARPDLLGRTITMWRGEMTVDEMLRYNVGDTTVHAWDLARAIGVDDTLDADLVDASLALYAPIIDTMRAPRAFAGAAPCAPDADPQTRLLALVGRAR